MQRQWHIIPNTGSRDCKTAWSTGIGSLSRHQQIADTSAAHGYEEVAHFLSSGTAVDDL